MTPRIDNTSLKVGFIAAAILISINLWSFQLIPKAVYTVSGTMLMASILLIVCYHHKIFRKKTFFKTNALLFLLLPLLSAFGALYFHEQPLNLSVLLLRPSLLWLFYFVLHIFDVPQKSLYRILMLVGAVWSIIAIVQQFTFPTFYFYTRGEGDGDSILRAGVYRFMHDGILYGMFMLVYSFYQYLSTRQKSHIPYIIIGLLGFYFFGTRQFAIAVFACLLLSVFTLKGTARVNAMIYVFVLACLMFFLKDVLFSRYIEMTNDQFEYGDNIRQLAGDFYLNDYWPHWGAKILGNGPPHHESAYGEEMQFIVTYYHYHRSDVGIIGIFSAFGLIYVLNIIWTNIKGMLCKLAVKNSNHLKLVFLYSSILLLTNVSYANGDGILFYCIIFFLIDKAHDPEKVTVKVRKEKPENELTLESI